MSQTTTERIGLVRHFPVQHPLPRGWKTAADLHRWRTEYDASPTIPEPLELGVRPWAACLCSDLARTVTTARAAFSGSLEVTPLLREPELAEFRTGNLRLPVWVWRWVLRLAWLTGHRSQRAGRDEFKGRVQRVADLLVSRGSSVLVVSHAGMMAYLSAELKRRGYEGPNLRLPKPARLYVFEWRQPR